MRGSEEQPLLCSTYIRLDRNSEAGIRHLRDVCNDAHLLIPKLGGKPTLVNFLKGKRYFLALPLFHAACLTFTIEYNFSPK